MSDNWQYILDVCDKVGEDPEQGSRLVIELVEKRLQQRDANVQLRTLSLLTSIAENCGSRVKQEIATKSFTSILLNKLKDSSVHKEIKVKVVQVLGQLSESFQGDPSLRPIQDANREVQRNYSQYFPPDKPQKHNLDNDRLKEEEDLKAAIALSLAENNQASIPTSQDIQLQQQQSQQPIQQQAQQVQSQPQSQQPQQQQQSFSRVRALYDSCSQDPADLHFRKGDIITVLDRVYKDWGKGSLRGQIGLFPFNYVTPLYDPTPEELIIEAEKESKILLQARQVERLLALLSSGNDEVLSSEEFQKLYQEIALMKPELGGLIEKYRVRRDELLDLHGKLKDATVKYEELTDPLKKPGYGYQQHGYQPQSSYQYQQPQPSLYNQQSQQVAPQTPQQPQIIPQTTTSYPQQSQQQQPQPPITTFPSTSQYPAGYQAQTGSTNSIPQYGQRTSYSAPSVPPPPQHPTQQQQQQHSPIQQQHTAERPYPY